MILESLLLGGVAYQISQIEKSTKNNEEAMKKYAKAFSREEEAKAMIKSKESETEQSILKLAKRKKAIIETSINDFLEFYKNLQKIEILEGAGIKELNSLTISAATISQMKSMTISSKKTLDNKELITTFLFRGMYGSDVKNSERNISAANSQMRAANVVYSQAETICVVYDAIKTRADRMSDLLKRMNYLLTKSIAEANAIVDKNGYDVAKYNDADIYVVVNCINWLKAIKDIIDTPLFNESGELEETAIIAIEEGEKSIALINQAICN